MIADEKQGPNLNMDADADIDRRDFLNRVSGGALGVAAVGAGIVTVKYISPNVLF